MVSTNPPVKFGTWTFPSKNAPTFNELTLTRAQMPVIPQKNEFQAIITTGWQNK